MSRNQLRLQEVQQDEKDEVELPGYEQANHLKEQGKDKLLGLCPDVPFS